MDSAISGASDNTMRNRIISLTPHALAILGVALSFLDSRFLLIAVAGFFGPGILDELGWLKSDEYQKETRLRASHHAFLLGGVFLALIVSFNGMGQRYSAEMHQIDDAIPASLVLMLMLAVYYLSGLVRYWGPRIAAFRIVILFTAVFVALFSLALFRLGAGSEELPWSSLFQILAFAVVMLGAAFLGRKHPRPAALILLLPTGWLISVSLPWSWLQSSSVPWEVALDAFVFTLLLPVTAIVAFLVSGKVQGEAD